MSGFSLASNELACDGVLLSAIAADVGTPFYVYSASQVRSRFRTIDDAFGAYPHRIHYALKANSSLAIAELLRELGSGVDANSIWEIELARRAGFAPDDVVFTGVGKSDAEIECAAQLGLRAINVESGGELARVERFAAKAGRPARVAIRVNPDIDAKSHPHISTGLRINKFGVPVDTARALAISIAERPALRLTAIHVHVGSQITTLDPLRKAAAFLTWFAGELRQASVALEYLDVGGGLGIQYDDRPAANSADYVAALVEEIRPTGLPIVVEPGRSIIGPAGALIARVLDVKPRDDHSQFVILDAGMTELMRPALYNAFHRIEPVRARGGDARSYEIVGPVCESSDVLGRDRAMAPLEPGDLVAIRDAGAYGSAMASNYNRRPLPAEVLADAGRWRIIRRRQTLDDMLALES
jgi:diaminopimelate decarboxylase